jgi:probable F420-dependent oxidoreductase
MTRRLGFGAQLKATHPPAEQWDTVRAVERAGFDSVWTGDHVSFHSPLYESLTLLASYASITSRIKLGTGVFLLALRPPAIAAKMTATLDALSNGRLIFGVGVGGENPKEFALTGSPHGERGARVTEAIDVVRTLWRDTPASFDGRFTRFEDVSIDPKPVQQPGPPIWIGGRSEAALARAGRQGDGWISYVVQPSRFRESLEKVQTAAASAGRRLDTFVPAHLTFITVGKDYESARATWVRLLSKRYAQDFGPLAQKYGIIGTAAQCAEQLAAFVEAGCRYFVFDSIVDIEEERAHLATVAAELIPLLA